MYEAGLCDCGFHESLTGDKVNVFEPGYRICPVCAGGDQYQRMLTDHDKKTPDDLPARAPRASDGRKVYMRRLTSAEAAQLRANRQNNN